MDDAKPGSSYGTDMSKGCQKNVSEWCPNERKKERTSQEELNHWGSRGDAIMEHTGRSLDGPRKMEAGHRKATFVVNR